MLNSDDCRLRVSESAVKDEDAELEETPAKDEDDRCSELVDDEFVVVWKSFGLGIAVLPAVFTIEDEVLMAMLDVDPTSPPEPPSFPDTFDGDSWSLCNIASRCGRRKRAE